MDAQYTVLARRFRPQTFTEVVGQDRISQTLRNAIQEGRVAHAYLFTGARGVGKTSMARIFAKALNCPNLKEGVPCNGCEQCLGIAAGNDVDVSEIDGASNRGIDDIRSLRANVGVKSMRSKYKVYIIDEVHMLTKEAFNALLKTLEEPPPLVKFVFCTTEPNKVPDTILSRCQRFDFGTISIDNISLRLSQLALAEGFQVDPAAVELVARRAAGSMRDSQSLFDQLLAFGSEHITDADVHRLLGTAPDDRLIDLVEALIARDRSTALELLDAALREGVQLEAFTDQLISYFRDLMVTACGATEASLLSVGTDQRGKLQEQAGRWGLQTIVAAMQILAETKARMQRVTYGRALAELALVRVSLLEDLDQLDHLIAALKSGQPVSISGVATTSSSVPARLAAPARSSAPSSNPGSRTLTSEPTVDSRSAVGSEKKNDVEVVGEPLPEPTPPLSPVAEPTAESVSQPPFIEWKPGCEQELHSAVIARTTDTTSASLRRVAATAIAEPNILEFSFAANYDLDRRGCDCPEVTAQLERIVSELVGQPTVVRFKTEAVALEAPAVAVAKQGATNLNPKVAHEAGANRPRNGFVEAPDDVYVQSVMALFGVKGWRVQQMAAEPISDGEVEPTRED
ncbi:MAG: DNA polymerase III subunit gamma/tau [Planctomycetota bacterium]|nr:MAG: DNA polymerase III subunit gamma/tau [Planctomycetota bacterium]